MVACRRSESRTASSWMIPAKRVRRPFLHPRMRRQVLARRADVGEPRPRPFDELLEQRDSLRLGVDRFGHVVEQQDVAGEAARVRCSGRLLRDRGRLHPQQSPVAGRGDEMRALALLAFELPLHRLDRVQDQVAVDDAEHRAAEAEERSVAAAEDALRGGVVEQDPALAIADEHALVQLGDQRGEPAPLRLDAGVGVGDRGRDVRRKRGPYLGKLVDRAGERLQLGGSGRRDAVRGVALRNDPHVLGQPARRCGEPCEQAIAEDGERRGEREREQHQQADPRRREDRHDRLAVALASRSDPHEAGARAEDRERRPRAARAPPPALRGSSGQSSLTFATSSRVEKGLVTYASAPSSSPLATSTSRPFAERRITFTPRVAGSLLSC